MKKKIIWGLTACLMLVLVGAVSCSKPATKAATQQQPQASQQQAAAATQDRPQYGGTLTTAVVRDPTNWDTQASPQGQSYGSGMIYEQFMTSDWTKGAAGTNELDWAPGSTSMADYFYPQLATSWENPDQHTWILNIRQGVHWQKVDTPAGKLMGGREMTINDVLFSLNRSKNSPKSWVAVAQPVGTKAMTFEKTGPWQVTLHFPKEPLAMWFFIVQGGGHFNVFPPEVIKKYGNLLDWHNAVGTGPFMISDFVSGSDVTLVRNPDYWDKNPIGPGKGDQLPYVDKFVDLVIPDTSTQIAAMRTGKVDMLSAVARDQAQELIKAQPDIKYDKYLPNTPWIIGMRTDKPDLPYHDVRVRQALMMATDFQAMKQQLYQGDAEIDVIPWNKNFVASYTPLDQMPQAVQDLYTYNPQKAKQLLAEAGYPNGFNAQIVCANDPTEIDELSIFKAMWAKVGVNLEIQPLEYGAYNNVYTARSQKEMIYRFSWRIFPVLYYFAALRGVNMDNSSYVDDPPGSDPYIEKIYNEVQQNVVTNMPEVYKLFKQMRPYLMEQAFVIPRPTPYTYNLWWPWVKNYHGEGGTRFIRYHWIDQKLKTSMGH